MDEDVFAKDEQYFQAKIQIRPKLPELLIFVQKQVKKKKNVLIARIEEIKNGFDIYITSQKFARTIGKKLKQSYPKGELKISRTLHTRDKLRSRDVYRGTVLFRLEKD